MPTDHYQRVRQFMVQAGQDVPDRVTIPDSSTRLLRAKLILEEALETVAALGIKVKHQGREIHEDSLQWETGDDVDLEGVIDGCADISVVTIGTMISFGVEDKPVLEEVDGANLRKFGPGSYSRGDGKWMKPPDWTPPDVLRAIGQPAP